MNLTDDELNELHALLKLREYERAQRSFVDFAKLLSPPDWNFDKGFHKVYYTILELFAKGLIKKLIITVPPQHGKSEGSTRLLPAFIFGQRPNANIAVVSYAATQAQKFNRQIQRTIDDENYYGVFPQVKLAKSRSNENKSQNEIQTASEFHIAKYRGSLKSIGRSGGLTGNPVDILIMDDLYKDDMEGNSPVIREAVKDFYITVADTRLHNESQQLIVFTRWHQDDLIGFIERKQPFKEINSLSDLDDLDPETWVKINFEAIKTGEKTELDPREKGEALFPERHSIEKLMRSRSLDPDKFNCLYQGNPRGTKGLLYPNEFKTYNELPELVQVKNYTDTAEGGNDYLCSITYGLPLDLMDEHIYILDVIFSDENPDITENKVAKALNAYFVSEADIESNSGGKAFARNVAKMVRYTEINELYQSGNKESRIISNRAKVNRVIVFPKNWDMRFADFYDHIRNLKKNFKSNKHDDGADVLTGIVERRDSQKDYDIEIHND